MRSISSDSDQPSEPKASERSGADDSFVERVLEVVASIPPGRAMTYGGVAAVLGSRASRAVGQTMAYYGADVAWWRVVRSGGLPPRGHEQPALEQYRVEGTPLRWGTETFRVDLKLAEWSPPSQP